MPNKRWTDLPVPSSYRAIGRAARASQRSSTAWPTLVAVPALAVVLAMHVPSARQVEAGAAEAERETVAQVQGDGALALPSVASPRLDREQTEIAHFIARTYRVASEQAGLVVDLAYRVAREFRLDPHLLLAVVAVESRFVVDAQSPKGAQGLMQVRTHVHADKFAAYGGVSAAFDPMANLRVGARILREYIARDGTVEGGLKAYVGAALLPEDGGYGSKVLFERDRLAAIASGRALPSRGAPSSEADDARPSAPGPKAGEAAVRHRGEGAAGAEGALSPPAPWMPAPWMPALPADAPGPVRGYGSEA